MSGKTSFSASLVISGARFACRECDADLGPTGENWKDKAVLQEEPLAQSGGPYRTAAGEVLLRRFFCPSCATLLDTETALEGEPFLFDRPLEALT